jgi:MoaA/NifB/PqqE/SkfB family radical SAM enzyme
VFNWLSRWKKSRYNDLLYSSDREIIDFMTSREGRNAFAVAPELRPWCSIIADSTNGLSIDSEGNVTTCCYDDRMLNKLGNVYEDGIMRIWSLFQKVVVSNLYELEGCRGCIRAAAPYSPSPKCIDRLDKEKEWNGRAKRLVPSRLILEPASLCNYACEGCPANWNAKNIADLDRLFDCLADGLPLIEYIAFGLYGEPLLNKKLGDFFIKCRRAAPDLKMQLLTNGMALTEQAAAKIVEAEVDTVTVAIHGGPLTENMLKYSKRGADYGLVLRNIAKLRELRDAKPHCRTHIQVRTVLFNWNDTDELMDLLRTDVKAIIADRDCLYWVIDVAGPQAERSSKRFLPGSPELEKLEARGEFNRW